jgi:hypothetical protein
MSENNLYFMSFLESIGKFSAIVFLGQPKKYRWSKHINVSNVNPSCTGDQDRMNSNLPPEDGPVGKELEEAGELITSYDEQARVNARNKLWNIYDGIASELTEEWAEDLISELDLKEVYFQDVVAALSIVSHANASIFTDSHIQQIFDSFSRWEKGRDRAELSETSERFMVIFENLRREYGEARISPTFEHVAKYDGEVPCSLDNLVRIARASQLD